MTPEPASVEAVHARSTCPQREADAVRLVGVEGAVPSAPSVITLATFE